MDKVIRHYFNKCIEERVKLEIARKDAWLLVLSDGQKVVFRACPDCTEIFEREKFFYDSVNKRIGKICPEVYVVDGTCEYYDKSFQVEEYIEGETLASCLLNNPEYDAQKRKELYYKIGETVARINQVEIDPNHPYVIGRKSWEHYIADKIRYQLNQIVKNGLITTAEIDRICESMCSKKATHTCAFLHRDIRPLNMIYNNGKIFVIDAETCEFGDPLNELACIQLEWNYWEMYDSLLEGYKSVLDIDVDSELFYYYQLEQIGETLDMHFNYGCKNNKTQVFLNMFNDVKERIRNLY